MTTHRGRKPSTKPGSQHLSALQAAHGKGDFKAAKIAALMYANAAHKHHAGHVDGDEDDLGMGMVQPGPPPSVKDPVNPSPSKGKIGQSSRMQQLAKLVAARRKPT